MKTLSENMFDTTGVLGGKLFVRDVKEAVRRLKEELPPRAEDVKGEFYHIIKIIDEIFGKELT